MSFRSLLLTRSRASFLKANSSSINAIRRGHAPAGSGIYRADVPPVTYGPKIRLMKFCQVVFWWHIFYSFWYDPEMLLGHPEYQMPNPELWTDEELGIPPDDYDEEF